MRFLEFLNFKLMSLLIFRKEFFNLSLCVSLLSELWLWGFCFVRGHRFKIRSLIKTETSIDGGYIFFRLLSSKSKSALRVLDFLSLIKKRLTVHLGLIWIWPFFIGTNKWSFMSRKSIQFFFHGTNLNIKETYLKNKALGSSTVMAARSSLAFLLHELEGSLAKCCIIF